jgi:hypothetical protein
MNAQLYTHSRMTADTPFASTDRRLYRLLWLSIAAAVATISLKTVAWLLTGSVGLLSTPPSRSQSRRGRRGAGGVAVGGQAG